MAVGRIQFENGLQLGQSHEPTAVLPLLRPHIGRLAIMGPGLTPVTPRPWTKHAYEYVMEVDDNGEGTLHRIPRNEHALPIDLTNMTQEELQRIDIHHIPLQEAGVVPLIGGHPDRPGLHMFEFFMPVPNETAFQMPARK